MNRRGFVKLIQFSGSRLDFVNMHHLTKVEFCFNMLVTDNLVITESRDLNSLDFLNILLSVIYVYVLYSEEILFVTVMMFYCNIGLFATCKLLSVSSLTVCCLYFILLCGEYYYYYYYYYYY